MKRTGILLSLIALLVLVVSVVLAQPPSYDLSWWTVDGGGATFSTGGGYSLGGTAGQPDAGVLSGGGYSLGGGFWKGGLPRGEYRIFLPMLHKGFDTSLIFSDDFEDGTLTEWTPNNGTWTNPGTYMQGDYALENAWNIRSSTGSDVMYEGTVTLLSGEGVGLVFRSSADGESSYDVILGTVDGIFKISKRPPYQVLASYGMTVEYNRPYRIKVVASGSTIDAYLDGVKLLTATDTTYTSGNLGVMLYKGTATYDDLQAWELP